MVHAEKKKHIATRLILFKFECAIARLRLDMIGRWAGSACNLNKAAFLNEQNF